MAANLSQWVEGLRLDEPAVAARFDTMFAKAGHWLDFPSELEAIKHLPLYALAGELAAHGSAQHKWQFDEMLLMCDTSVKPEDPISLHDLHSELRPTNSTITNAEKRSALNAFLKQTDDRPPLAQGIALLGLACGFRHWLRSDAQSPGELTKTDLFDAILTRVNGLPSSYAKPIRQALREPLKQLARSDQDQRPEGSQLTRREAVFGVDQVQHAQLAMGVLVGAFQSLNAAASGRPGRPISAMDMFLLAHQFGPGNT